MEPFLRRLVGEHPRVARRADLPARVGIGDVRIAAKVARRQNVVPERVAVVHAEPVAPVVTHAAVLRRPGRGFNPARVGIEPKVATANHDRLAADPGADVVGPTVTDGDRTGRTMDAVVQPPVQAVDAKLMVALKKSLKQCPPHVRPAVAVRVFCEQNDRCRCHQHTTAPGHDAGRERQPVEEDCGVVVTAVAIPIGQQSHAAAEFSLVVHPQRVVRHLRHPQRAVRPPVERHRVAHQRFAGDQLQLKSLRYVRRRH